jgi:hypothetical protein
MHPVGGGVGVVMRTEFNGESPTLQAIMFFVVVVGDVVCLYVCMYVCMCECVCCPEGDGGT